MHYSEIIVLIALGIMSLWGLYALFMPVSAAKALRMQEIETQPAGFTEFRTIFGGFMLFAHLMPFVIIFRLEPDTTLQLFMLLPLAAGWLGAGFGRALSLALDKDRNRGMGHAPALMICEFALGLAMLAPLLQLQSA